MTVTRRNLLLGGSAALASVALSDSVLAHPFVDAGSFGVDPSGGDQTQALQMAIDAAASLRQPLFIGAGSYEINGATIASPVTIRGSGQTVLRVRNGSSILSVTASGRVALEGLTFDGEVQRDSQSTLLELTGANDAIIRDCRLVNAAGNGINAHDVGGRIENCILSDIGNTGIFCTDSRGLDVFGNTITRCGNGGIRIWRYESGADGSRVFGNRISQIGWVGGGNGQNGNGINVFRADGVSVSDNSITDCAFSAIRLNATNNTRVTGNHCADSDEVSIYSEFGFSGSIISDNVIERGAAGISITNFDHGGRLCVCSGNIVRDMKADSPTNPDVVPYGIAAEADAVVTGNVVDGVPGTGIVIGWGPYLRDVIVSENLVRGCDVGIAVSVVPDAGHARISGNLVSGSRHHAIVGTQWREIVTADLTINTENYGNIAVRDNSIF
ncbi:TIGR03808 family TAT-translocated repetitive protein [Pelagibacterium sediminicola]|uniref:TIGR03808 family TAT-translocated repetitive protein n=1 Tax=Pelagibacterium sediminicola TaxID=2248761 RepID=UPI0013002983|nr:TIGR03808 family TAT-translocated repetitive protein [Pelagibacterium sediminicola]